MYAMQKVREPMKPIDLVFFDLTKWACPADDPLNCMSPEELSKVKITQLAENDFHVQYDIYNPYHGFDYKMKITETENEYEFAIYESVYADCLIIVRDKNLNFLYRRDIETREII